MDLTTLAEGLKGYVAHLEENRDRELEYADQFRYTHRQHLVEARANAQALSALHAFTDGAFGVHMDNQPPIPHPYLTFANGAEEGQA